MLRLKKLSKENRLTFHVVKLFEAEAAAARAEVFGKLNVGDVVTGSIN